MKLTVEQVRTATLTIAQIIREQRSMPQKGKFRLARMHTKLLPEFKTIDEQWDALIKVHGVPQTRHVTNAETGAVSTEDTGEWVVPPENVKEFNEAWKPVAQEVLEIDVEPVALCDLDCGTGNGAIEAHELIALGDLVIE